MGSGLPPRLRQAYVQRRAALRRCLRKVSRMKACISFDVPIFHTNSQMLYTCSSDPCRSIISPLIHASAVLCNAIFLGNTGDFSFVFAKCQNEYVCSLSISNLTF